MKKAFFILTACVFLFLAACSPKPDHTESGLIQDFSPDSIEIKVTGVVDQEAKIFAAEALQDCGTKIKKGDTLWVTAELEEESDVLAAYEKGSHYKVDFIGIDETPDAISICCIIVIQYDDNGNVLYEPPPYR